MEKKEHIISILVHNKPDVLARIAGTLGGKGYNIESLCVNTTTSIRNIQNSYDHHRQSGNNHPD